MKHKKKILAVLAIVFMAVMATNFGSVDRVWISWLKGNRQPYKGNIYLWHISDEFNLKLPYASMLKKYEKKNFGVFITVSYLTAEQAQEKISQGELPDIVTYSKNFFTNPPKELEPLKSMENPILKAGKVGKDILAYPICYDTYTLIINDDMLSELEMDIPGIVDIGYITSDVIPADFGEGVSGIGFSSYGAALNFLDVTDGQYDFGYKKHTLSDFEKGKVAVMVCSSLDLEKYTGELPSYSQLEMSAFTDRVRFLSVYGGKKDENRLQCSREIAEYIMGEKMQKQVSEYGFSPLFGYTSLKSPEISPVRVFENDFDEQGVIEELSSNKGKLLQRLREITAQ